MARRKFTVQQIIDAVPPDFTLRSVRFAKAWRRWVENRLALGKPVTIGAFQIHMSKCAVMGQTRAIAAIEFSIGQSYQSIFEQNSQHPQNKRSESCL